MLGWTKDALAELEVAQRIRDDVTEGMEKNQREYLLRQQMAAIRKELGEDGDGEDLVEEYRDQARRRCVERGAVDDATAHRDRARDRPARAHAAAEHRARLDPQLARHRLRAAVGRAHRRPPRRGRRAARSSTRTTPASTTSRTASSSSSPCASCGRSGASTIERRRRGPDVRRKPGAIIALVGPPGVGKTSLGASIARALGRKFVRVALGGVRDEAEIRGHRRTYVGAQAGRIVRAMQEAGSMNPVFLLDEVDKVGSDWRGDPSSALLEVLDPAQNHSFRDHYLEVDLDLSDVLFIATANVLETIPGPLLDRMEIVRIDGYTEDEKVAIARDHLVARQVTQQRSARRRGRRRRRRAARDRRRATPVRPACAASSARSASCCARPPRRSASGAPTPIEVDERRRCATSSAAAGSTTRSSSRTSVPGVATGLAVTGVGGDVLFVEATSMPGEPGLTVTGQLGDVMKESAQIALSYVRSQADDLGIDRAALDAPVPRALPRGGGAEGRAVRRHHDDHGAGVAAHGAAGAARGRHDR